MMKAMFISAAWFNWVAAVVFGFASERVLPIFSMESSPTSLFFIHLFCTVIFFFGIAYYRAATDMLGQAPVIRLGAAAKLALVFVATVDVFLGLISWPILIVLAGDLVYALLFYMALSRMPAPARI